MAKNKVVITCAVTGSIHTPSMSPHLPVTAGAVTQTWYDSLVDLECAADTMDNARSARFVVEEHWLV